MVIFLILIVVACVLLVLTVLAQNPKSGMAANFGASNQVMGARQTTDFLEKFTWGLIISLVVLCLAATMTMSRTNIDRSSSAIERSLMERAAETDGGLAFPGQTQVPVQEEIVIDPEE